MEELSWALIRVASKLSFGPPSAPLGLFENLVAESPDVPDYQGNVGMVQGNLGWLALKQDNLPRAVLHLEKGRPGGGQAPPGVRTRLS